MKKLALQSGLSEEEYNSIENLLGRTPSETEVHIFSAMWSEHCSYKNSWKILSELSGENASVPIALGSENVGAVLPDKETLWVFKMESHNHPSAVHPFNGAATGVGGILRDIFTTGAYPLAILNSLRFGEISKSQKLIQGIIEGIAFYGNAFGVPNVGGEMFFHPSYEKNPLVNVLAFGAISRKDFISAKAEGIGNPVFIVGNLTGKDGLHGAAFASENLNDSSLQAIQIPDPLQGKSLLEAIMEAKELILAMQDMGAAGIISSCSEMSFKGNVGMKINLNKVPTKIPMKPYEILLSESQERMLIITKPENKQKLREIFEKYDLVAAEIGEIILEKELIFTWNEKIVARLAPELLVREGKAPKYSRNSRVPDYFLKQKNYDNKIREKNLAKAIRFLLRFPAVANKKPLTLQYDDRVGLNNVSASLPTTAALVFDELSGKIAALTTDCNPLKVYKNPYEGTLAAVCESVLNVLCSGAQPLGITDCLNFGNPYNPEVFWQFEQAVKGLKKASKELRIPVVSGNVSFYNQIDEKPVLPTPTIGLIGILTNKEDIITRNFKKPGDPVYLLGDIENNSLNASVYLYFYKQIRDSIGTKVNPNITKKLMKYFPKLPVNAANDVSEGGLIISVIEMLLASGNVGVSLINTTNLPDETFLFGEGNNLIVVSVPPEKQREFEEKLHDFEIPFAPIGNVNASPLLQFKELKFSRQELENIYRETFRKLRQKYYETS